MYPHKLIQKVFLKMVKVWDELGMNQIQIGKEIN